MSDELKPEDASRLREIADWLRGDSTDATSSPNSRGMSLFLHGLANKIDAARSPTGGQEDAAYESAARICDDFAAQMVNGQNDWVRGQGTGASTCAEAIRKMKESGK